MDTGKYFSFSRIAIVIKRDFIENWKSNIYRILGPYAALLFVMVIGYLNHSSFEEFSEMVLGVLGFIFFFGGIFYASYVMEPMNTQQKRVTYLMLPATHLEKFVSRVLYVSVGFFMMLMLALLLAEMTRFLFLPLFDLPDTYQQSLLPYIWQAMTNVDIMDFSGMEAQESYQIASMTKILAYTFMAWGYSLFLLGGCYWYKHAFLKTLGVLFIVNNILGVIFFLCVENWVSGEYMEQLIVWYETNFSWLTIIGILYFLIVLVGSFCLFNWWLSYRCFTRSQVIKSKFNLL